MRAGSCGRLCKHASAEPSGAPTARSVGDGAASMPGTLSTGVPAGTDRGAAPHEETGSLSNGPTEVEQPNSASRQRVSIQLIQNGRKITALVPNSGCLNFIEVFTLV